MEEINFDTPDNRDKVKKYDYMMEILDSYKWFHQLDLEEQRRLCLVAPAQFCCDEERFISQLLYVLEDINPFPESFFETLSNYYYYIFSFDNETNRTKVNAFDMMQQLYNDYKLAHASQNTEYIYFDNDDFADQLFALLTLKKTFNYVMIDE